MKNIEKSYYNNGEWTYKIFRGIEEIDGEWLMDTEGYPAARNDYDDLPEVLEEIESFIDDENTYWEPIDRDEARYIADWLEVIHCNADEIIAQYHLDDDDF